MTTPAVVDFAIQQIVAMEDLGEIRMCAIGNGKLAEAMRQAGQLADPSQYYDRAERMVWAVWRGGHLLRKAERNVIGRPSKKSSDDRTTFATTIDLHGLKRDMAYRWIAVAWLTEEDVAAYIGKAKDAKRPFKLAEIVKAGKRNMPVGAPAIGEHYRIVHADLADVDIEAESVDCIITDPPYQRESIGEYGKLSAFAARVLKPGGSCLAMAGQSYLPDVIAALSTDLTYHWTISYLTPGGQAVQQWDRHVNTFWKPVLWFVKDEFEGSWAGDVVKSDVNDNDKRFHEWGQSESGVARLVESFTKPDDLIADPFVGGGTTAIAALARGRRFIGIDRDIAAIDDTVRRIAALRTAEAA